MNTGKSVWGNRSGSTKRPVTAQRRGGFTLFEVVFASTLAMLLFLTMLEVLFACQRIASNVKWRLAADAIAFDTAWDMFNQQTTWFDTQFTAAKAKWEPVPAEATSVWYGGGSASLYWSVTPVGVPITKWVITTNVQWPTPGGTFAKLPKDYVIERYRVERNLFRVTN
jgi:hypothetical protein